MLKLATTTIIVAAIAILVTLIICTKTMNRKRGQAPQALDVCIDFHLCKNTFIKFGIHTKEEK